MNNINSDASNSRKQLAAIFYFISNALLFVFIAGIIFFQYELYLIKHDQQTYINWFDTGIFDPISSTKWAFLILPASIIAIFRWLGHKLAKES